jgi:hypothetical protein
MILNDLDKLRWFGHRGCMQARVHMQLLASIVHANLCPLRLVAASALFMSAFLIFVSSNLVTTLPCVGELLTDVHIAV